MRFTALLLLFWVTAYSAAAEKTRILIVDGPIDLDNKKIAPFVDIAALKRIKIRLPSGERLSLFDLNQRELELSRARMKELIRSGRHDKWIEFMKLTATLGQGNTFAAANPRLRELALDLHSRPNWERESALIYGYHHGTHVAGLITRGLNPELVTIIPAAVACDGVKFRTKSEIEELNEEVIGERTLQQWSEISRIIHDENIRACNLSIGGSSAEFYSSLLELADGVAKRVTAATWDRLSNKLRRVSEVQAKGLQTALRTLVQSNRNTVFVISAGNRGIDLAHQDSSPLYPSASVREPNALIVQADRSDGGRWELSNYGAGVVNISAPGVAISSAGVDDIDLNMSGTSMAAPQVTRAIALKAELDSQATAWRLVASVLEDRGQVRPGFGKVPFFTPCSSFPRLVIQRTRPLPFNETAVKHRQ